MTSIALIYLIDILVGSRGMKGIMVMMKSKILTILILSLLYISTSAAPTDVNGWGKIEWDMSLSEVKSIFPDRNVTKGFDNSTGSGQFIVDEYRLYGELFQTRTFWWQSELINIHVSLKNFNLRNENLSELAKKIVASLKSKYGKGEVLDEYITKFQFFNIDEDSEFLGSITGDKSPPREGSGQGWNTLKIRWVFPSTIITYDQTILQTNFVGEYINQVTIKYEPNESDKL